ncbi:YlaH-like family protein [Fervidibacillus halotolerans]|uniref:YlaH-like family protein n=1 Tax=Fervidibacillus halotolerans TaxID=2980027 RepID=A0A9E8RZE3_9BACI|nr:YlaH-like family protein [Fervidibacillus halotolerans]WAA13248.1 YlaH-like family protein [Fervidibacillus halotolerans]
MIENRLSFFASLFQVDQNPQLGMWLLYGTIVILSIIAYHLGFSHKISILKRAVVYIFLLIGSSILSFLGTVLPVAEGLLVIVLVLMIYRIRRKFEQREQQRDEQLGIQKTES